MGALYWVVFFLSLTLLAFSVFYIVQNEYIIPMEERRFNVENQMVVDLPEKSNQFYPAMRYRSNKISYALDPKCDTKREKSVRQAFDILSNGTGLTFYPARDPNDAELSILCSEIAPAPEEEGHFIAGEGGPSEIIDAKQYSVIMRGKVSLYRSEKCETPQIAIHEILHALGFNHNNNPASILYPITDCSQRIDQDLIEQIRQLYVDSSLPDLLVESAQLSKSGIYLYINVTIANYGLADAKNASIQIIGDGHLLRRQDLYDLEIGTKKIFSISNLLTREDYEKIYFIVSCEGNEISQDNNMATIVIPNQ